MEHLKFSGGTLLGIVVFPADAALAVVFFNRLEELKGDSRIVSIQPLFMIEADNASQ